MTHDHVTPRGRNPNFLDPILPRRTRVVAIHDHVTLGDETLTSWTRTQSRKGKNRNTESVQSARRFREEFRFGVKKTDTYLAARINCTGHTLKTPDFNFVSEVDVQTAYTKLLVQGFLSVDVVTTAISESSNLVG